MAVAAKTPAGNAYLARYAGERVRLDAGAQPWLAGWRRAGADAFRTAGFPTIKNEAWRFTPLHALIEGEFSVDAPAAPFDQARLKGVTFNREAGNRLVFVNGRLRDDLSSLKQLSPGIELVSLAEALRSRPQLVEAALGKAPGLAGHPFAALNAAFAADGYVLHIAPDTRNEAPIEILWIGSGADKPPVYHPRNLVVLGRGAHATIIEHHVGLCIGSYFSDSVTEISLAENALLRHCKVQEESREAFHIATTGAHLADGAQYDSFVFSVGGRVSRNEIHVALDGKRAHCRLNGAYLGRGEQIVDHTTVIDHLTPETTSKELYKGVLDGRARGVFQGKIVVRPGAQKTDGHQMNRALLLSDKAEINSKPELEINADDVKCSHGATAGELDDTSLFYLRSRGIPEAEARRLLVEAFLAEVVDAVALAGMRLTLEHNITRWMAGPS
jgi:Fe-S cluster assembly protein SufD